MELPTGLTQSEIKMCNQHIFTPVRQGQISLPTLLQLFYIQIHYEYA